MTPSSQREAERRQEAIEQQQTEAFNQQQTALNEQLAKVGAREEELAPLTALQDETNLLTAQENLKFARGEGDIGKETEAGFGKIIEQTREFLRKEGLRPGDTAYDTTLNNLLTGLEGQRDEIRFGRRSNLQALSSAGEDLTRRNTLSFLSDRTDIQNRLASSSINRSSNLAGNLQARKRLSTGSLSSRVGQTGRQLFKQGATNAVANFATSPFLKQRFGGASSGQTFLSAFLPLPKVKKP